MNRFLRFIKGLFFMSNSLRPWKERLTGEFDAIASDGTELRTYLEANFEAIGRAVAGRGTNAGRLLRDGGVRMAVNIAAVHVRAFCKASARGNARPYLNCYDLQHRRIGGPSPKRTKVDQSLPTASNYELVCFGAVELNGTGVRFYGDFCLVLSDEAVGDDTDVLDRNSYDIEQPPLSKRLEGKTERARDLERKAIAGELAGKWTDLEAILTMKILDRIARRRRRLTVGEISDGILSDEDYVEVLWLRPNDPGKSFGTNDLYEVRISAADVALEERISARARFGPPPSLAELIWRAQRRRAENGLRAASVPVRVVTTTGRVRS